jgi:carbon storage regulator
MLILSRKINESIVIDGRIIVKVLRIDKDTVKLGIQAPTELPVHREEIHAAIQRAKQGGAQEGEPGTMKMATAQPKPMAEKTPTPHHSS